MSTRQGNLALATGVCCGNANNRIENLKAEIVKSSAVFDSSATRPNLPEKITPEKIRIMRLLQSVVTDLI